MQLTVTAKIDDFVAVRFTGGKTAQAVSLIEAAPDLLAALQLVYANAGESPEWIRSRIAPAIARATGGQ